MTGAARVGAAVDIGSNSVHLLVAAQGRVRLRTLVDESVQLGLGATVDRQGRIGAVARRDAVATLAAYVERARSLGAQRITLVGTEPLRRASDRSVFQADVLRETGVRMHVLSHEAEAELTLLGVTGGRPPTGSLLVVDIGGGSTELIVAAPGRDAVVGAIAVGSARLAASIVDHDPPTWFELNTLRSMAIQLLATMPAAQPDRAVVAGGTGTNTNRLLGRLRLGALDARLLERAMTELSLHPAEALAAQRTLSVKRVRQLPAGIALLEALLSRYGLTRLATSDASLREGAIVAADRFGDAWPDHLSSMIGEPSA
jgi:exopolyphosphatase/pppGpp-phosphohydrolase